MGSTVRMTFRSEGSGEVFEVELIRGTPEFAAPRDAPLRARSLSHTLADACFWAGRGRGHARRALWHDGHAAGRTPPPSPPPPTPPLQHVQSHVRR
eukprot:3005014-Rhodomonas_salina.2